eukprot:TRINITY_DN1392_c0_g1_i1.p1 TRINITY_DN1392_c0_g1~~TRINITY_DN1392_c0_g1_i1.p1  ORF type:complete len:329 (-),score=55.09 TRINITY_DN1392_c0_g1_i1:160-1146(-)
MAKRVVRVHFIDGNCRAVALDESATVDTLRSIVIEKIELKEDGCFALFERRDDWERCLDSDEKPCELMDEWSRINEAEKAKKKDAIISEPKFLFKKKIFLRDDDRELKDLVAKHHLYIQALYSVIESEYPSNPDEAINLAGLQVQVTYADHNPSTHQVGFLSHNLKNFIPKHLMPLKKPQEWESLIFKAHAKNQGKTAEDAKTEYLDIVKQWPFYGTTFFPPCKSVGNKKLPNKVIIGVNAEGILLLKTKDKELISTHPFTEICSWLSSSTTFAFEFGSQNESQKYAFDTKHGAIIAATIQTYIDILVQMLKYGEDEDDDENANENMD